MKPIHRETDLFSTSFLDVISCGFGAIVLLILISKSGLSDSEIKIDTGAVLRETISVEEQIRQLSVLEEQLKLKLAENEGSTQEAQISVARIVTRLQSSQMFYADLQKENLALSKEQKSLMTISLNADTASEEDDEVGGIPVDSDYVIFVIDTSGSMRNIWPRVRETLENVLDIHPTVKGFQILNDNGHHLVPGFDGRWIKDTKKNRSLAIKSIQQPSGFSNSSPMEGIRKAFRTYVKDGSKKISIYVFGDDYTGGSYDDEVALIDSLNVHKFYGHRKAKIHGIGFLVPNQEKKFSTLMREIAHRNNGTFLALP